MIIRQLASLLLLTVCLTPTLLSQGLGGNVEFSHTGTEVFPSPTAASFAKVQDIPVDYYNGTANVGIPLHNFSYRGLSVPISLNYTSTGLKVQERASWVGLGWNLQVGGVITRVVRGMPDDYNSDGYLYKEDDIKDDVFADPNVQSERDILDEMAEGEYDTQPDKFIISTPTFSGEMYYMEGEFRLVSKRKVTITHTKSNHKIVSWTITDENGIKYTFDKLEDTHSYTTNTYGSSVGSVTNRTFTSAWYLTKMEHPQNTGDFIFEYDDNDYSSSQTTYGQGMIVYDNSGPLCNPKPNVMIQSQTYIDNEAVYLKKIKLSDDADTYVEFINSAQIGTPNELRLYQIDIYEGGVKTKLFTFHHGYFSGSGGHQRLRLDKVQEYGVAANNPPYEFTYNSGTIPDYDSYAVDYWGYYNGQVSNTSYVPTTSYGGSTIYTGANRNSYASNLGMLTKIEYPTGGSASFTYEVNDYSYINSSAQSGQTNGGGMRVSSATYHDGISSSNDIIKYYDYDMNDGSGRSSGVIYGAPTYLNFGYNVFYDFDTGTNYSCNFKEIMPSAFYQLGDFSGGHLGYKKVTETSSSGTDYGKVIHHFQKSPNEQKGRLVKQEILDESSNLIQVQQNKYSYDETTDNWAQGLELERKIDEYQISSWQTEKDTIFVKKPYTVRNHLTYLKSDTVKLYNGSSDFVKSYNEYEIDTLTFQLTKKTAYNSNGQSRETSYGYSGGPTNEHIYNQPTEVTVKVGSVIKQKTWIQWTNSSSISPGSVWRPYKFWKWSKGDSTASPSSSNADLLAEVKEYDSYGNTLEYKNASGATLKNYYGSNGSPYTNATTNGGAVNGVLGVYMTGIEQIIDGEDSSLCSDDDLCSKAVYNSYGLMTSTEDPNGATSSFEYDGMHRLDKIKNDANQTVNEFTHTFTGASFSNSNPNWVESKSYSGSSTRTSRAYADGLGRSIQTVTKKAGNVIVSANNYDDLGRDWKGYRAFSKTGTSLGYVSDYASRANTAYSSSFAFAENEYEESPLARLGKAIPLGGTTYGTVDQTFGVETVISDKLAYTQTTDPNSKVIKTYTDGWGQTVRSEGAPGTPDSSFTENEYNALGQLVEVRHPNHFKPPSGSSANDWVTTYSYDKLGNMTSKTGTDFGTVNYEYNKAGQLRYSQTAQQADDEKVAFTVYDDIGRAVKTGIAPYSGSFSALDGNDSETFESTEGNINGANAYEVKPDTDDFPWDEVSTALITNFSANNTKGKLVANIYRVGENTATGLTTAWQLNLYSYDSEGRVAKKEIHMGNKTAWKGVIEYSYNRLGELTRRKVTFNSKTVYHHYEYNDLGQLTEVTLTLDGTADTEPAEITYSYHADGQLKDKDFRGGTTMDYTYDIQGRLTKINDPSTTNDPFAAKYTYFDNGNIDKAEFYNPLQSIGTGHDQYRYHHSYDGLNRLKWASYKYNNGTWNSTNKFKVNNLNYDSQGNITSLRRYDENNSQIDNLTYSYTTGTNRLSGIIDGVDETTGIAWDAEDVSSFSYDANGNMIEQDGKFDSITYNEFNLPSSINTGLNTLKALYSGAGHRILKDYSGGSWMYYLRDGDQTLATIDNSGNVEFNIIGMGVEGNIIEIPPSTPFDTDGTVTSETEGVDTKIKSGWTSATINGSADTDIFYFDVLGSGTISYAVDDQDPADPDMEYRVRLYNESWTLLATDTGTIPVGRDDYAVSDGRYYIEVRNETQTYNYGYYINLTGSVTASSESKFYLKDHLGSTRAIVDDAGNHEESFDYYPFGLEMPGRSSTSDYLYKYTGHERDNETGINLDYMLARGYDPAIGRFLQTDPLQSAIEGVTPYHYIRNNPINGIDPTGMKEYTCQDSDGNAWSEDKIGSTLGTGDWCASDRENNTPRWQSANDYNLSRKSGYLEYQNFTEREALYRYVANNQYMGGDETYWVAAAAWVNQIFISNERIMPEGGMITANRIGVQILYHVWGQLGKLNNLSKDNIPINYSTLGIQLDNFLVANEQLTKFHSELGHLYSESPSWGLYFMQAAANGSNVLGGNTLGQKGLYLFGPKFKGNIRIDRDRQSQGMRMSQILSENPEVLRRVLDFKN